MAPDEEKCREGFATSEKPEKKQIIRSSRYRTATEGRNTLTKTWVAKHASSITSIVVKQRDACFFREVELAVVNRAYRPCVGWKTRDKSRTVDTGVNVCCLGSYHGHERGACMSVLKVGL